MKTRRFNELWSAVQADDRHVCVGLDSDWAKIPVAIKESSDILLFSSAWNGLADSVAKGAGDAGNMRAYLVREMRRMAAAAIETESLVFFNAGIVQTTCDIARVYKPNLAFYLARGEAGITALRRTVQMTNSEAPEAVVILDAKCTDIGNTNNAYVEFLDLVGADAITLHPYFGGKALAPFLSRGDKGCFVLCRTSNPDSDELQGLQCDGQSLYMRVMERVEAAWNKNGNCGLVAGATNPADIACLRKGFQGPLLIPGAGTQGGDVEAAVVAALSATGVLNAVVNSSSGVIFSDDPRAAARALHESIEIALAA